MHHFRSGPVCCRIWFDVKTLKAINKAYKPVCFCNTNSLLSQELHCSRPHIWQSLIFAKRYSPCCCRGTTQRTRWIAKWKELPLKRLLNDQQLYAAATAGVRRKQGKMPATNKQEISCRYVHVHALFSMCVLIDVNCIFYQ